MPRGSGDVNFRRLSQTDVEPHKLASNQLPTKESVALHDCAAKGDIKGVQRNLNAGGNPNWFKKPEEGASAVHVAAEKGHAKVLELLLQEGGVIHDTLLTNQNTPLHLAAKNGNTSCCEILLERGAEVDSPNAFGNTALHQAVSSSSTSTIKLLLKNGADAAAANHKSSTPLHFTMYAKFDSPSERVQIARMLVDAGAVVNRQDDTGMTCLHVAARDNDREMVEFLLDSKADVGVKDVNGHSPQYYAEAKGNEAILKLIAS